MNHLVYDVWLNNIKGIGPVLIHLLLETFETSENVYHASKTELMSVHKIGPKTAELLLLSKNLDYAQSLIDFCLASNITLITHTHPHYPYKLLSYNEAPLLLYAKGNLAPLASLSTAAIVGARRCSEYGKKATKELVAALSIEGKCIMSGLAKGIDGYSHTYALKNNAYTVAVLGTGVEKCYPSEHTSLMEAIIHNGAVISQFPPKTTIHKQYFLTRNELIAMLCDEIYVMQATLNSGALYTAECGLKYKKTVYALPGSIYDNLSMGCHSIIEKGASIYTKAPASLKHCNTLLASPQLELSPLYAKLLTCLSTGPLCLDALCATLGMERNTVQEIVFELEMQDQVAQIAGVIRLSGDYHH